jgi:hypothetical protein
VFVVRESLLDPDRGYKGERVEGLDFYVEHLTWKKLPKEVFESYGGFEEAKKLRDEAGYGKRVQIDMSALKANEAAAAAAAGETPGAVTANQRNDAVRAVGNIRKEGITVGNIEEQKRRELEKKALILGLDLTKLNPPPPDTSRNNDPKKTSLSFEELKKRFMSAAVGVEVNKRRKTESYIINEFSLEKRKDEIPFTIPTVTWNLLENK